VVHLLEDRRDHFETIGDIWDLARTVIAGRKEREIAPTMQALREFMETPDFNNESEIAKQRIREMSQFIDILTRWSDEMLKLDPPTLIKILKLGASVQKLIGRKPSPPKENAP